MASPFIPALRHDWPTPAYDVLIRLTLETVLWGRWYTIETVRGLLVAIFLAVTLSEMMVSPLVCRASCPSSEDQREDRDACSPWCLACSCCHLAHTVCPEVPAAPTVSRVVQLRFSEIVTPLPVTPPRDILHVPLPFVAAI